MASQYSNDSNRYWQDVERDRERDEARARGRQEAAWGDRERSARRDYASPEQGRQSSEYGRGRSDRLEYPQAGGYAGQDDAFATESNPGGYRPNDPYRQERERAMRSNELRDRYERQQAYGGYPDRDRSRSDYEASFGGSERSSNLRDAGRFTRASQSSFLPEAFDERSDQNYDQWVRGQQGDFRREDQRGAGGNYSGYQGYAGAEDYRSRTPYAGAQPENRSLARDRKGPKGYTRSDERLREDICERLTHSHHLDVSDVSVTVQDGRVTLEGTVNDRRAKHDIEDVVDNSWGVRDIDNRIRVNAAALLSSSASTTSMGNTTSNNLSSGGVGASNLSSTVGSTSFSGSDQRTQTASSNSPSSMANDASTPTTGNSTGVGAGSKH
ncbi:MAG: BON domain-containing protein [Rhodocyclaceae bacterium]